MLKYDQTNLHLEIILNSYILQNQHPNHLKNLLLNNYINDHLIIQ